MKKVVLFLIAGMVCNAMAQKSHKAAGDNPVYSKMFSMNSVSDSTLDAALVYTYNAEQRVEKMMEYYPEGCDSVKYEYDQDGRLTLMEMSSMSEIRVYDDVASRIESSNVVESLTLFQLTHYGVNDMQATATTFEMFGISLEIMDCDSSIMYGDLEFSGSLLPLMSVYPVYQNGLPVTAEVKISSNVVAIFLEMLGLPAAMAMDLSIDFVFTHNQDDQLTDIKGSTVIMSYLPLNNFITMSYQYNGDLLTESQSVIDVDINIPLVGAVVMYEGTKTIYSYNSEDDMVCESNYSSNEKGTWNLDTKIWHYYETPEADIALVAMTIEENDGQAKVTVSLENAGLAPFVDVPIRAQIFVAGEYDGELGGTIPSINPFFSQRYEFHLPYTIPESSYTLVVFVGSQDNNASNDTLRRDFTITGLSSIESNTFSVSQNYPNPAVNNTSISYSLPQEGEIIFNIFSISGQLLYTKTENTSLVGEITLNLSDYAPGIYFYTVEYNRQRIVRQMNIVR